MFAKHFEECLKEMPVTKEDTEQFLSFVTVGSFAEARMQLGTLEQIRDNLGEKIKELEKENIEKSRMAVGLGAMGGLFLVIVLI